MRIVVAFVIPLITIVLILLLNTPLGSLPALGKVLDPINGWTAAAESSDEDLNHQFSLKGLKVPVTVWLEDRMVPHLRAENNHDLYYVQGYIHAYFRLWQMDFQIRAAAGRVGEVVGEKWQTDPVTGKKKNVILEFDRTQRRKGMVFGAENSLKTMEAEPRTKEVLDAYTAGVNEYIDQLQYRALPIEYKLMGYMPEHWDNLKTALLLKYMADDLTGYTEDIQLTILRDNLSKEQFELLFPERLPGATPVIPAGTRFENASMPNLPAPESDSLWSHFDIGNQGNTHHLGARMHDAEAEERRGAVGSNSWAISGAHTGSGAPILCNDPHLRLGLPSLWFEMQLQAPDVNVYGVSLPGAPGIVIGFNDSISWGMTNNYRDVKDFYEIEAIDRDFYRFDGKAMQFSKRAEVIKIKGKEDFVDTVFYTLHGPVIYDKDFKSFPGSNKMLAVTWMAHRGTNELLSLFLLNRAQDYIDFTEAIMHFQCPAQNIAYADRAGNIALWGQGQFINKWKDQGRFVMKGNTSATVWGGDIPMTENPNALNPEQGFLSSANQVTTDSTYPYWYNGYFSHFRAWRINEFLNILPANNYKAILADEPVYGTMSMPLLQNDVTSYLAARVNPYIVNAVPRDQTHRTALVNWDGSLQANSQAAAVFQVVWSRLYQNIWEDEFAFMPMEFFPSQERTMQLMLSDSTADFYDDKRTSDKETLGDLIRKSYREALDSLGRVKGGGKTWSQVKSTQLTHLARLDAFSYKNLSIGGWSNTINATKSTHGPSWRMIVEMGRDSIRAYGVYPGGQSGNPGSKFYGTFVDHWAKGKYYPLLFLPSREQQDAPLIKYTWSFQKL